METDPEICAPIIHDTITSSPPDNDLLGTVPFSIATESALFISEEASLEKHYEELFPDLQEPSLFPEAVEDVTSAYQPKDVISHHPEPKADITPTDESLAETTASPITPDSTVWNVPSGESIISDSCHHTSTIPVLDVHSSTPETQCLFESSEFAPGALSSDQKFTGFHDSEKQGSTIEAPELDVVREAGTLCNTI